MLIKKSLKGGCLLDGNFNMLFTAKILIKEKRLITATNTHTQQTTINYPPPFSNPTTAGFVELV